MSLFKSTFIVSGFTLLSRILGYVRDILIALTLGTGFLADAFFVAFRLPNFFRTLTAEGALNAAFVPLFSKKLKNEGKKEAVIFASKTASFMIIILVIFTMLMLYFMPEIMHILAPGFIDNRVKFDLTVKIARIVFPYLAFISLVALMSGMLNSIGKFGFTSSASIWLNICSIAALSLSIMLDYTPLYMLAYSVLISGVVQLLWLIYGVYKNNLKLKLKRPKSDRDIKVLFKRMIPGIIGGGVTQINLWVNTVIATTISGAVSYLYYADRMVQFPLAIIGTAMGTVLLPSLSKSIDNIDKSKFIHMQNRAVEITMLFIIPASFALFLISDLLISVMFERGEFDRQATIQTSKALTIYALALPAFVLVKIFAPVFFSNFDTKTPVKIAFICLMVNIIIALSLVGNFGHLGIATATSLSSWLNACLLMFILYKKNLYEPSKYVFIKIIKMIIASIFMTLIIDLLKSNIYQTSVSNIFSMIAIIFIGAFSYFITLIVLKTYNKEDLKRTLRIS